MNRSIITLQFGNYSNHIGAHWWNIQDASFVYNSDVTPEIDHDILYREGENLNKEVTYTPRLLLVDLKENTAHLPLRSDLYECASSTDVDDELWSSSQIEVIREPEHEKNEYLLDLEKEDQEMNVEAIHDAGDTVKHYTHRYELDDKVQNWPDYLGVKFHPRSVTITNEKVLNTYAQGVNLWGTRSFSEDWADKCNAYVEECDCFEGFQTLFDCTDGFSGLSCSTLTFLREEHPKKSVFALPSFVSSYPEEEPNEQIRLINTVLSLSELIETSDAFLPLCTDANAGLGSESPRQFDHLRYNSKLSYHSSALLAAYMDTISLNYRQKKNIRQLSSLLQELTPCGFKLLSGTMRLPFPLQAGFSVLESMENLEEPFWTPVTPRVNVTIDSAPLQQITVRGLSSFALLPSAKKRTTNPAYSCQSVSELLSMYLEYSSSRASKGRFLVKSYDTTFKVPKSYPNIFCDEVTRIGCVAPEPMPIQAAVVESPMMAGLHNCSSASSYLSDLCDKALDVKFSSVHQFSSAGFEQQEFDESIEKLLMLHEDY